DGLLDPGERQPGNAVDLRLIEDPGDAPADVMHVFPTAHPAFRGVGRTSNSINDLSNALPRLRTLCTNSKKPKYSGNFACEIRRWGRSKDRSSDQNPSRVFT